MSESWEEIFAPSRVPGWLVAFDRDPKRAVDSLLWGRFGHLQATEPADLLLEWAQRVGDGGDFLTRLDAALAAWVARHWGTLPEACSAARAADVWTRLAELVACLDRLEGTAGVFRDRFEEAKGYLGPLSPSPARDPHGRYLAAIAEYQTDRSLAPYWWQLCDLPDGEPYFHGRYAIAGLSGLRGAPDEEETDGFRAEVVRGIVRLARAFRRQVERKALDAREAESEFMSIGQLTIATFAFPELWSDVLEPELEREHEAVVIWLGELVPGLRSVVQKEVRRPRCGKLRSPSRPALLPGADWEDRGVRISQSLAQEPDAALPDAERLLGEERSYAERTGNSDCLVRLLGLLSTTLAPIRPHQAVAWAEEAITWEPWNVCSWSTLTKACLQAHRLDEALAAGWEAVARFPENAGARTDLGEVLQAAGRLSEAEAVYRETVERFPRNAAAKTGLTNVLRALDRRQEAAEAPVPAGPEGEPEVFAAGEVVAEPAPRPAQVDVRRRRARHRQAVGTSEARLYRRLARRAEESSNGGDPAAFRLRAERRLEEVLRDAPRDPRALTEKSLLLVESTRFEQARALVAAHLDRLPAVPAALLSALARIERDKARADHRRLDEAAAAELLAVPHRLQAVNRACEPLVRLQEARAYLALSGDGELRRKGAARALKGLQNWIRSRQGGLEEFEPWFGQQLLTYVLAPVPADREVEPPDVDAIEQCLTRHARLIDGLEEDFGVRLLAG